MRRVELQKYVKGKVPYREGVSPAWKSPGLKVQMNEVGKARTYKEGESGQGLRVVSFVHQERIEK